MDAAVAKAYAPTGSLADTVRTLEDRLRAGLTGIDRFQRHFYVLSISTYILYMNAPMLTQLSPPPQHPQAENLPPQGTPRVPELYGHSLDRESTVGFVSSGQHDAHNRVGGMKCLGWGEDVRIELLAHTRAGR